MFDLLAACRLELERQNQRDASRFNPEKFTPLRVGLRPQPNSAEARKTLKRASKRSRIAYGPDCAIRAAFIDELRLQRNRQQATA